MAKKKNADGSLHPRRVGGKKANEGEKWTPSELHLEWYRLYTCEHKGYRTIGVLYKSTHTAVREAVHKVSQWVKLATFETIIEFRERQTETLEQMVEEAIEAWHKSKGEVKVKTTKSGKVDKDTTSVDEVTERVEISHGETGYLDQARQAMADIRKIWGVDKPAKLELGTPDDGNILDRVAGVDLSEAIRKEGQKLIATADALKAKENESK